MSIDASPLSAPGRNELTPAQLDTLRHMLGINDPTRFQTKPYRNYYCANTGDPKLHGLVEIGMVEMYRACEQWEFFTATEAGIEAAVASAKSRLPKGPRRRYLRFLEVREMRPYLSFRDFLLLPGYKEVGEGQFLPSSCKPHLVEGGQ